MAIMRSLQEAVELESELRCALVSQSQADRDGMTTYLVLVVILACNDLVPYLVEFSPNVDAGLDLLCVLLGRILEPNSIALPAEVGHNAVDQRKGSGLVEGHRGDAVIGQLSGDRGHGSRLSGDGASYLGTRARGIVLARMERRDGRGKSTGGKG
jgi:hypothetical protein